jgi:hypothetical protein
MAVVLDKWEAEGRGLLEPRSSRLAERDPFSKPKQNNTIKRKVSREMY